MSKHKSKKQRRKKPRYLMTPVEKRLDALEVIVGMDDESFPSEGAISPLTVVLHELGVNHGEAPAFIEYLKGQVDAWRRDQGPKFGCVNARDYVFKEFPPEAGKLLAQGLLRDVGKWADLTIDLRELPSGMLIGSFYFNFLQTIHDFNERFQIDLREHARAITWLTLHDFQQEMVQDAVQAFVPETPDEG